MKTFFGGVFIEREKLQEAGIDYPIKLEYYKKVEKDIVNKNSLIFGISIVKTEYIPNDVKIESTDIERITDDEKRADEILKKFKEAQVTPINAKEIMLDMSIQIASKL